MKICHCGSKFDFDNATIEAAPADWPAEKAWRCGRCGNFSHAYQEEVEVVRAPAQANAILHAKKLTNGQHIITWAVGPDSTRVETVDFFPWDRRHPMTENESLIFATWELLMSKVEIILKPAEGHGDNDIEAARRDEARHQGRGIAEVLAIQMKPFMTSTEHVIKCAVKKYKDPEFEVPGLGLHLWDPLKNPDGSDRTFRPTLKRTTAATAPAKKTRPVVSGAARSRPVARPKAKKLDADAIEGIKSALDSGAFTRAQIASMWRVTEADLDAALSS